MFSNAAGNSDILVGKLGKHSHLKYVNNEEKNDGIKVEQQIWLKKRYNVQYKSFILK